MIEIGFQHKGSRYNMSDEYTDILVRRMWGGFWELQYEDSDYVLPDKKIPFRCLHELQHALRMCGVEIDIDNIK